MLQNRCNREVFIFVYTNFETREDYTCYESTLLTIQSCLTTSNASHIIAAFKPDLDWSGDVEVTDRSRNYMVCYDVALKGNVKKTKKSLDHYDQNYVIRILDSQYTRLRRFLDRACGKPFNKTSMFCNFLPVMRWIGLKGKGYYCAQLVAEAMKYAKIIKLAGTVETRGYITPMLCCCIPKFCSRESKPRNTVRVPEAHCMTVELLIDVIRRDNASTFMCLSTETNPNEYAADDVVVVNQPSRGDRRRRKRHHRRRKRRSRRRDQGGHLVPTAEVRFSVQDFVSQPHIPVSVFGDEDAAPSPFTKFNHYV